MTTINFVTTGGGTAKLKTRESQALGPALEVGQGIMHSTVMRPAEAADRDALVVWLNGLDYSASKHRIVVLEHSGYRIEAIEAGTQYEVAAWADEERKAMAKRLGLKDPLEITLTITEVTP